MADWQKVFHQKKRYAEPPPFQEMSRARRGRTADPSGSSHAVFLIFRFLRKKMKIVPERFYYALSEYGNTVSNTIPIALHDAMADRSISSEKNVLIAGFGVGYSWGGTVLRF